MEAEKTNIEAVLNKVVEASKKGNIEMFSEAIAHDKDLVCLGTARTENLKGWEQLKETMVKQFNILENTDITVNERTIKIHDSGKVAWFSENLDFQFTMKEKPYTYKGVRQTGVLEKRDGKWLIVQLHMSVPLE